MEQSVKWRRTAHVYELEIRTLDKWKRRVIRLYEVKREQSAYRDGQWTWTVRGAGLRGGLCDQNGATHKRAVAAVQAAIALKE